MTSNLRFLPWGVVTLAGIYLAYCAMPARQTSQFELDKLGNIPIICNGRVQPLDTLARNSLMIISGRQTFVEETSDGDKVRQPAIRWLMDVWSGKAAQHKVIRIENDQVLALLELPPREGLRYSMNELKPNFAKLYQEIQKAGRKDAKERDVYELKLLELYGHIKLWEDLAKQDAIFPPDKNPKDVKDLVSVGKFVEQYLAYKQDGSGVETKWGEAYVFLDQFYFANQPADFNKELDLIHAFLQKEMPAQLSKAKFETLFNRFAPFWNALLLYLVVFALVISLWLTRIVSIESEKESAWPQPLRKSAFALCVMTLAVHMVALVARMYLMDRWGVFVTNLYSSAIFIGWGCVALGLVMECIFPIGVGLAVGSITGAVSLIIAHMLSLSGDTLEMLVAVLDTNFWLATHVTCVTFGYTATFFAGFLGIAYVLAGLIMPNMPRKLTQIFSTMIYGVICFALLLSFTGTVLGGIWADESWGRFWGWDPKENGALLIVMMNALTLHARWGGLVKSRGVAVLAILGNVVTAWSWFGVNMLGVGLHSYGFTEGALFWLLFFVGTQFLLSGLGMFEPVSVRKFFSNMLALNPPAPQQTEKVTVPS
jgi:ABC-type transport system involved in cytochrome c biogenesis permease subunit